MLMNMQIWCSSDIILTRLQDEYRRVKSDALIDDEALYFSVRRWFPTSDRLGSDVVGLTKWRNGASFFIKVVESVFDKVC